VGVTRGTLEKLNRDELQGVIAHEFSHIFNGDMRLNIRLIGILNGILLLHIMGMIMLRSAALTPAWKRRQVRRTRRRGRGHPGDHPARQSPSDHRLYRHALRTHDPGRHLAATRIPGRCRRRAVHPQPGGIAGALRKIDRSMDGGKIEDGHAMEMSHLFFANSFHTALDRLYATHPPIADRIRAIDPSGAGAEDRRKQEQIRKRLEQDRIARAKADGKRISGARTGAGALEDFFGRTEGAPGTAGSGGGGTAAGGSAAGALGAAHPALRPEVILAAIGTLDGDQVSRAGKLLAGIPPSLREAAHEPFGAEALVIALLLATRTEETGIPAWLRDKMDPKMAGYAEKLLDELRGGDRQWYLPLTELALPALRHMSEQQYRDFRATIQALILEDKQVSLFEFVLEKLVARQLDAAFSPIAEPKIRHYHLKTLANEFSVVLSAMAHASGSDTRQAWDAGTAAISDVLPGGVTLLDAADCAPAQLDPALDEIAASATPVKKYILTALLHSITVDEHVSVEERELLRAIFETIDIPIPLDVL
jgi:hypothetical protein